MIAHLCRVRRTRRRVGQGSQARWASSSANVCWDLRRYGKGITRRTSRWAPCGCIGGCRSGLREGRIEVMWCQYCEDVRKTSWASSHGSSSYLVNYFHGLYRVNALCQSHLYRCGAYASGRPTGNVVSAGMIFGRSIQKPTSSGNTCSKGKKTWKTKNPHW